MYHKESLEVSCALTLSGKVIQKHMFYILLIMQECGHLPSFGKVKLYRQMCDFCVGTEMFIFVVALLCD